MKIKEGNDDGESNCRDRKPGIGECSRWMKSKGFRSRPCLSWFVGAHVLILCLGCIILVLEEASSCNKDEQKERGGTKNKIIIIIKNDGFHHYSHNSSASSADLHGSHYEILLAQILWLWKHFTTIYFPFYFYFVVAILSSSKNKKKQISFFSLSLSLGWPFSRRFPPIEFISERHHGGSYS